MIDDGPLELRVLGPLDVTAAGDGRRLPITSVRQRKLLATLALGGGTAVSMDRIVDSVWASRPPPTATAAVQVYVSAIRRSLGPSAVRTVAGGYELPADGVSLDANRFASLIGQARDELMVSRPVVARRLLDQALALWRGDPYLDLSDDFQAVAERARLGELRVTADELLAQAQLEAGSAEDAVPRLQELVTVHPTRERFTELLMLALYRAGRQADALEAYQRARLHMIDELGVEPGPALRRMHALVLGQDQSLARRNRPRPSAGGLPALSGETVGRSAELAVLAGLLTGPAPTLVSITGPGGVGKTRLAIEAAAAATPGFPDGVTFADLSASVTSSDAVSTIAAALAVSAPSGTDLQAIEWALADRDLLLVLDNLEQIRDAGAVLHRLLSHVPAVRMLVTSRRAVGLAEERELRLAPLPVPGADGIGTETGDGAASLQLFIALVRRAYPGLVLDPATSADAAAICRRLDGLPLAITLAAALCRVLSVTQLREQLESGLGALRGRGLGLAHRQQTLASTIDWSARLVGAPAMDLFERFGVFAGGASLAALVAVTGHDVLDELMTLNDHGLVQRSGDRFTLLSAAAEYVRAAAGRRADWDVLRERHARFFAQMLGPVPETLAVREWARAEMPNIRLGRAWAQGRDDEVYVRLTTALAQQLIDSAQLELATGELTAALEDDLGDEHRARLLLLRQDARYRQGDHAGSVADVGLALELAQRSGALWCLARCLHARAYRAMLDGDLAAARTMSRDGMRYAAQAGDQVLAARFLNVLGATAAVAGDLSVSNEYFVRYGRRSRELGQYLDAAIASMSVAENLVGTGSTGPARQRCADARQLMSGLDLPVFAVYLEDVCGLVEVADGRAPEAAACFAAALETRMRHGVLRESSNSLGGVAGCLALAGEAADACGLWEAVTRLAAEHPEITTSAEHGPVYSAAVIRHTQGIGVAERDIAALSYADLPLPDLLRAALARAQSIVRAAEAGAGPQDEKTQS